eukprot:763418-Hanusia_phi.AAC.14
MPVARWRSSPASSSSAIGSARLNIYTGGQVCKRTSRSRASSIEELPAAATVAAALRERWVHCART